MVRRDRQLEFHYHFCFIELLGMLGRGTPDDPGSDYGLFCAIEASTQQETLDWGYHVHGDFARGRTRHTDWCHNGDPIRDGEIDGEADLDELLASNPNYAVCKVGEYPNWIEPWKNCNADGVRRS